MAHAVEAKPVGGPILTRFYKFLLPAVLLALVVLLVREFKPLERRPNILHCLLVISLALGVSDLGNACESGEIVSPGAINRALYWVLRV